MINCKYILSCINKKLEKAKFGLTADKELANAQWRATAEVRSMTRPIVARCG